MSSSGASAGKSIRAGRHRDGAAEALGGVPRGAEGWKCTGAVDVSRAAKAKLVANLAKLRAAKAAKAKRAA